MRDTAFVRSNTDQSFRAKAEKACRKMPARSDGETASIVPEVAAAIKQVKKRSFRKAPDAEKQNIVVAMVLDTVIPGDVGEDDVARVREVVTTAWELQAELRRRWCPKWR